MSFSQKDLCKEYKNDFSHSGNNEKLLTDTNDILKVNPRNGQFSQSLNTENLNFHI